MSHPAARLPSKWPVWQEKLDNSTLLTKWSPAAVVDGTVVDDPSAHVPGFDHPRRLRSSLNRFRTGPAVVQSAVHGGINSQTRHVAVARRNRRWNALLGIAPWPNLLAVSGKHDSSDECRHFNYNERDNDVVVEWANRCDSAECRDRGGVGRGGRSGEGRGVCVIGSIEGWTPLAECETESALKAKPIPVVNFPPLSDITHND